MPLGALLGVHIQLLSSLYIMLISHLLPLPSSVDSLGYHSNPKAPVGGVRAPRWMESGSPQRRGPEG